MQDDSTSNTDLRMRPQSGIVWAGIIAVVAILAAVAIVLIVRLPDANAFNARVEQLFVQNDDLTSNAEIKLLEILAQSGTAFADTLATYRFVIFVLLVFAVAMLISAIVFLITLVTLNHRMSEVERSGIHVHSLILNREERKVYLNSMSFEISEAAIETLSVLCEARVDGDVLSGAEIEAIVSGRDAADCDEAAGATRIKRLRDALGNQMVSELLVRNISRKGYVLAINPVAIRMV